MKKGATFFNIIIIISAIALVLAIGYGLYYYISNYIALKEAEEAVDMFEQDLLNNANKIENVQQENIIQEPVNDVVAEPVEETPTTTKKTTTYKNYTMIGTIQIPKTKVKAPIVDKVTVQSISAAVATLYGPGLNEIGNTVLVAHNYRNGTFFSNNKKLVVGDKIYITDSNGTKVEYIIYKSYTTGDMDFSYATRDTAGKREISLSTCTTDPSKRLVIWAKEQ